MRSCLSSKYVIPNIYGWCVTVATDLLEALCAHRGVVCLTGAGGKKSAMYALADAHPGRVALSSTSHMYLYDANRVDRVVVYSAAAGDPGPPARVVAFAGPTDTPRRVGGLDPEQIADIWSGGGFDLFVIKADGARARWIKAPAGYEPVVPPCAGVVIPVVSARVLGRSLADGIAHRPALAAAVMDVALDAPLEAKHLARLLSSPEGALKGTGDARVIPLINMVDDEALAAQARDAARAALGTTRRFSRVVLATLNTGRIVDVIERADPANGEPP